jgi:hypothetical protein
MPAFQPLRTCDVLSDAAGMIEGDTNLFNGIACIFWSGYLVASIYRQRIPYSMQGSVVRRESPKLFWLLTGVIGIVAVWTGKAFVLHQA